MMLFLTGRNILATYRPGPMCGGGLRGAPPVAGRARLAQRAVGVLYSPTRRRGRL